VSRPAIALALVLGLPSVTTAQTRDLPAPRPVGTSTISGVVRTADAGATPVRMARVTLNSVDRGGPADTATTDAQGQFAFHNLPAGRYSLQATKSAWLAASYGAPRLERPGTPIAVGAGQSVTNLVIPMARGGVITGAVRDRSGEPQPGVLVRVMRFVTRDGHRTLERQPVAVNDVITNDEGSYRVYGLPPGDYIVVASARFSDSGGLGGEDARVLAPSEVDRAIAIAARTAAAPAAVEAPRRVGLAPVFYPGSPDMAAAQTIRIGAGDERSGIDIPFQYFDTAKITGQIHGIPEGTGMSESRPAECRMTPAEFEEVLAQPLAANVGRVETGGRVTFMAVPPGRYTLVCAAGQINAKGGPLLMGWAEASLVVTGVDQEVTLALGPASTMAGRIVFEGDEVPKDLATAVQLGIVGFGKARLLRNRWEARPETDGTFRFSAIIPGRWIVSATLPPGSPWMLSSITLGGKELDDFIHVTASTQLPELVATFSRRVSAVAGTVQDSTGRPAADYFVIAFPVDRSLRTPASRRIQSVRPASDGVYTIRGLPPGEYFLAALTDVEPGEWFSPEFLDQVSLASLKVRVTAGEQTLQSFRIAR
jgi:uncharacterized protein (DUF2141 family)